MGTNYSQYTMLISTLLLVSYFIVFYAKSTVEEMLYQMLPADVCNEPCPWQHHKIFRKMYERPNGVMKRCALDT